MNKTNNAIENVSNDEVITVRELTAEEMQNTTGGVGASPALRYSQKVGNGQ